LPNLPQKDLNEALLVRHDFSRAAEAELDSPVQLAATDNIAIHANAN
jgi:hypothetical protein